MTTEQVGFFSGRRYLLHDRHSKFTAGFDQILKSVGVEPVRLPPHSSKLERARYATLWENTFCIADMRETSKAGRTLILFPLGPPRVGQAEGSIDCPETARPPIEILPPESRMNILTVWVRFGCWASSSLLVSPKQLLELIEELRQFVRHPDER